MVREQREKKQKGQKQIRGLKARVGRKCCISRGESDCTVEVYRPDEPGKEVTVLE